MISGERPGSYQAHIAAQHVPKLRQFVETVAPQKPANARQNARIAPELIKTKPIQSFVRIVIQILLERPLGIRIHGPQLPYRNALAVSALALLPKKCRPATHGPYPNGAKN